MKLPEASPVNGRPVRFEPWGAGSKSEHEHASMRIAEAGNGLAPIFVVAVGAALLARDALSIFHEARTARAGDDFAIQNLEPGWDGHSPSLYWFV